MARPRLGRRVMDEASVRPGQSNCSAMVESASFLLLRGVPIGLVGDGVEAEDVAGCYSSSTVKLRQLYLKAFYKDILTTVSVHAMRTLTKYTTFSTPNNSINIALINDALTKIELLEPSKKFTYTEIANKYGL